MKNNQKIRCNVESCKYNSYDNEECTLNEIKVACMCCCEVKKDDTICDSYCSKDKNV